MVIQMMLPPPPGADHIHPPASARPLASSQTRAVGYRSVDDAPHAQLTGSDETSSSTFGRDDRAAAEH